MARCPCFGRKKKGIRSTDESKKDRKPALNARTTSKSSVKMNMQSEKRMEMPVSKEDDLVGSKAVLFSYRELATATNNFRRESLIGEGGFGPVYKGKLETTGQIVAVKQLNHSGLQGDKEFLVEVLMLSLLRHPNLVNLIGYCAEGDQRLLVYEFMPLGSLEDQLYDLRPGMQPLDWNTRMIIAAGAAKGLNFLHNEADPPVIYRDLKSSNILLDEGFIPKLSDFGLAKFGPDNGKSHVSTRVMGTHGYCAPEYAGTGKLTTKSDIYSFGVVLLELITGRRAIDPTRESGKQTLVTWVLPLCKERKNFVNIVDPELKGQLPEPSARKALEVALMCVREDAHQRPSIKDVVNALDYLTSKKYDPVADHRRDRSHQPEGRGGQIMENLPKLKNSDSEETRLLNEAEDRARAVAEAKVWGETWREKGRCSTPDDATDSNDL